VSQTVSVKDKQEFIRWFLKRYQMKRRECVWILNYLLSHDDLLQKAHFVEEAHYCPRAMVMSVTESSGVPFRFYKGSNMTADAEKSFHDLRLHTTEDMYIQLNFNETNSIEYLSVLEENQFMPKYLHRNEKDAEIAEQLIEHVMKISQQNYINKMIDEALDNGDKELFMQLTSQMATV
jgi:uncharacterized protein YpiB (UPF0302 family)